MYDVIVVGARCAGSPTAMLLARRGHKVLLLDRASFPSDTISTHFIQLPGMYRLHLWGVLDRVMATGCPAVTAGALDMDGEAAEAEFPRPDEVPGLAAPRRTVLDKILVDAAVEAGAELREGEMVDSLLFEDDRVVGVRGHTATEPSFEARARIVIGADGRNSVVARSVGAEMHHHEPVLGGGCYSYWRGVDLNGAEIYLYDGAFTVAFPTNDGLTTIAIVVPPDRFADFRRGGDVAVMEVLSREGTLGERVAKGERAHELIHISNLDNFLRQAWGPGWALVGDALYHKDPTPADGIADAFREADLLADAVDDVLSGRSSEEEAMIAFSDEAQKAALPLLEKTVTMSSFDKTPLERATAFLELQALHQEEVIAMGGSMEPQALGA